MKKIIGILGVWSIAMTMFFSTNALNSSNGSLDLASILNMNNANAECSASTCNSYCYEYGGGCILICGGVMSSCDGKSQIAP